MTCEISGKKILVTGGTGQVGSFLVEELVKNGAQVFVIGRSEKNLKEIKSLVKTTKIKFLECDLTDIKKINKISKSLSEINFLVHLSSELSEIYDNPIDNACYSVNLNINGIINLLSIVKKLEGVVYASSTAVYGKTGKYPVNEENITNPISFYGCSKLGAEKYLKIFSMFNSIPVTILRYSTIYGPRNRTNQVIPVFIKNALENKIIKLFGKGESIRDFVYISDVINATMKAIKNNQGGIFNIGTGIKYTMHELAEKISKLTNSKSKIIFEGVSDELSFLANAEKSKIILDFKSKVNLDDGLSKEIEWHQNNMKRKYK